MTDELWTLEQLPDRVAKLLGDDYDGQRNGRVRELPNGRAIRWYTTIGLVDRPVATRGRVALYGLRHALQLAAIKRLQALGRTLAEIQEELLGATDDRLVDVAKPAAPLDLPAPALAEPTTSMTAFWRQPPSPATDSATDGDTVIKTVHGIRVGDSVMGTVTVLLDGAARVPDVAELAELTAAAAPLLAAIDRLGLSTPTTDEERR